MSITNKTILEQANAAITAGEYEGFLAHCTDDTRWTFVGEQTLHGKPAVRAWMATAYQQPPQFRVEHLIAEADFVTALGTILLPDAEGRLVALFEQMLTTGQPHLTIFLSVLSSSVG
jgi:ketosteroid isomerase-like protein